MSADFTQSELILRKTQPSERQNVPTKVSRPEKSKKHRNWRQFTHDRWVSVSAISANTTIKASACKLHPHRLNSRSAIWFDLEKQVAFLSPYLSSNAFRKPFLLIHAFKPTTMHSKQIAYSALKKDLFHCMCIQRACTFISKDAALHGLLNCTCYYQSF